MIRKATAADLPAVAAIYEAIHDAEERGAMTVGWRRGVYPTLETARAALSAGDLYVLEQDGEVVASARFNQSQDPAYAQVDWRWRAADAQVMVMHTLTVDPRRGAQGFARRMLSFYESLAAERGCPCLRIDTNEKNAVARRMYARHGYRESGVIPCTFNGIDGVQLVCMEKWLGDAMKGVSQDG